MRNNMFPFQPKCIKIQRKILFCRRLNVYASNQSTLFITKPDLWSDPNEVIEYEVDNSNSEIEAACTAYGGNPKPEFHW